MELRIRVLRERGGFWGTGVQLPYDLVDWELIKKKSSLIFRPTPRALKWNVLAVVLSVFCLGGLWLELGPPWTSFAAYRQKQERAKEIPPERREAEAKLAELANAWKDRLAPEKLERIEREIQQRTEQGRQQAQRTDLVIEVGRQILLWPISLLFLWLGGWYGVIGIIRFPFEQLTIRRVAKPTGDQLAIIYRGLMRTVRRTIPCRCFRSLSWTFRRGRRDTTWYGLLTSQDLREPDLEFALDWQRGRPDRVDRAPAPVREFLEAMNQLFGFPIEEPDIEEIESLFGNEYVLNRSFRARPPTGKYKVSDLPRQLKDMLADPSASNVSYERKFELTIYDANGQEHTFRSVDEIPEELRRQIPKNILRKFKDRENEA